VNTIGGIIRRLRIQAGLSQQQLAGPELTRAFICMVERGKARPSMESLRLIAARLNQPVSAFLEADPSDADRDLLEVLLRNTRSLKKAGNARDAIDTLRQAFRVASERNLREEQFETLGQLGTLLTGEGSYDEALDCFDRFLELARGSQLPARIVQGYLHLGDTVYAMNQFLVARRYYDRAVCETNERKSLTDLRQRSLISKGNCLIRLGAWRAAAEAHEEAGTLHPYLGDQQRYAFALMGLGVAYRRLGRLDEAKAATLESHKILQKLGDRSRVLVLHNLATIEGDQGQWQSALPKFEICREAYRAFGWPVSEAALLEEMALYRQAAGDLAQAEALCQEALSLLEQQDEPLLRGRLLGIQGKLRLACGDAQWGQELLQAGTCILRYFADGG